MKKGEKKEIIWNVVNSLLAAMLVFLGMLLSGTITLEGTITAFVTFLIVAVMKFKDYWSSQQGEYSHNLFKFV